MTFYLLFRIIFAPSLFCAITLFTNKYGFDLRIEMVVRLLRDGKKLFVKMLNINAWFRSGDK